MEDEEGSEVERIAAVPPIYYYHPDHLGTSTALTDFNGKSYQFFLNLPFGETMAQQLGSNYYNSPFKFNGKELDEETGFYYYGARYYDPKISIWLSMDPLAEKFPNFNPYNYVMQNPLNLIDPTGMAPEEGGGDNPPKQINVIAIASYTNKPNDEAMNNALIAAKKTDAIVFTFNDFNDFKTKMKTNVQEGTVANLTLIEHGGYGASGLEFGSDYLSSPSQMKELGGAISPYLNKDVSPTLMVLACNFGAGKNPEKSIVKIQTLADASGATVIAPKTKGLTYQNMFNTDGGTTFYPILKTALKGKDAESQPNANKYLGKWIMMIPKGNNWNMELNQKDVFLDKRGNIKTNR